MALLKCPEILNNFLGCVSFYFQFLIQRSTSNIHIKCRKHKFWLVHIFVCAHNQYAHITWLSCLYLVTRKNKDFLWSVSRYSGWWVGGGGKNKKIAWTTIFLDHVVLHSVVLNIDIEVMWRSSILHIYSMITWWLVVYITYRCYLLIYLDSILMIITYLLP